MQVAVTAVTNEYGIRDVDLAGLRDAYGVSDERIRAVCEQYRDLIVTDPSDKDQAAIVHEARLELKRARIKIVKVHKQIKEDALAYCRACDGEKNRLVGPLAEEEKRLEAEEQKHIDYIKEQARLAEEAARAIIDGRIAELVKYGVSMPYMDLAVMSNEEYCDTLARAESEHTKRLAEEVEREAVRQAEDARLQKERAEQAERQRQLDAELAAFLAERKAFEQEKAEAEAKIKAEEDAKAAAEAAARAQIERDEQKAKDKARQKALKPDRKALTQYVDDLATAFANIPEPTLEHAESRMICKSVVAFILSALAQAKSTVESYT